MGFGIPVMPKGAFYVFADASKFTDDSYKFAFELLEKAGVGVTPVPFPLILRSFREKLRFSRQSGKLSRGLRMAGRS